MSDKWTASTAITVGCEVILLGHTLRSQSTSLRVAAAVVAVSLTTTTFAGRSMGAWFTLIYFYTIAVEYIVQGMPKKVNQKI